MIADEVILTHIVVVRLQSDGTFVVIENDPTVISSLSREDLAKGRLIETATDRYLLITLV